MKRLLFVAAVTALVANAFGSAPVNASEPKQGPLPDQTWEADEGPYHITGDIIINNLTVEAGTEVEAQGNFQLTITGKLMVEGEEGTPVVFTCDGNSRDCWKGIVLAGTQDGSEIQWMDLSHAKVGLQTNPRAWSVEDSYFHENLTGADITGAPVGDTETGDFEHNRLEKNSTGVVVSGRVRNFSLNGVTQNSTGIQFKTVSGEYSDNNIYSNSTNNASSCGYVNNGEVDATDNWWGTTAENTIRSRICDVSDEQTAPRIKYTGFLSAAIPEAAAAPAPSPSPSPSTTTSPSPSTPPPPTEHARSVTLSLKRHIKASGVVTVADGFFGCLPPTVTINYKPVGGTWKAVKNPSVDPSTGGYAARLKDRKGAYQTLVGASSSDTDTCLAAKSAKVRHSHRR
jgi:hypothetical protein